MNLLITIALLIAAYLVMTLACKGLYHLITRWER